jgi:hypothetical protein
MRPAKEALQRLFPPTPMAFAPLFGAFTTLFDEITFFYAFTSILDAFTSIFGAFTSFLDITIRTICPCIFSECRLSRRAPDEPQRSPS